MALGVELNPFITGKRAWEHKRAVAAFLVYTLTLLGVFLPWGSTDVATPGVPGNNTEYKYGLYTFPEVADSKANDKVQQIRLSMGFAVATVFFIFFAETLGKPEETDEKTRLGRTVNFFIYGILFFSTMVALSIYGVNSDILIGTDKEISGEAGVVITALLCVASGFGFIYYAVRLYYKLREKSGAEYSAIGY